MKLKHNLLLIFTIITIISVCNSQKRENSTTVVKVFNSAPSNEFSVKCFTPQYYNNLYANNCKPTSGHYPSDYVICQCTFCKSLEFHLRCHISGVWYPTNPGKCDPVKTKSFPDCKSECGDDSPVPESVRNVRYKLNTFITMPKFHCKKNCREVPLVCNRVRRTWEFENQYWKESCESKGISYVQIHKNQNLTTEVNFYSNLIKYSCDRDYELKGESSLTCTNGMLSGELPICIPVRPVETWTVNSKLPIGNKGDEQKLSNRELLLLPIAIIMTILFIISLMITLTFLICWCKRNEKYCFERDGKYIDPSTVQNLPTPLQTFQRTHPEYIEPLQTNHYEEINPMLFKNNRKWGTMGQKYNDQIRRESNLYDDIGPNLPPLPKV